MNPKIASSFSDTLKFQIKTPESASLKSDHCKVDYRLKETLGPGNYKLSEKRPPNCIQGFPGYNTSNSGPVKSLVDLESEFRGLNYLNSKCPEFNANPLLYKRDKSILFECKPQLVPESTKNSKSCQNISEIDYNRYEMPLKNFNIQGNSYIGQNTRTFVKDNTPKKTHVSIVKDTCNCYSGSHTLGCNFFHLKN